MLQDKTDDKVSISARTNKLNTGADAFYNFMPDTILHDEKGFMCPFDPRSLHSVVMQSIFDSCASCRAPSTSMSMSGAAMEYSVDCLVFFFSILLAKCGFSVSCYR